MWMYMLWLPRIRPGPDSNKAVVRSALVESVSRRDDTGASQCKCARVILDLVQRFLNRRFPLRTCVRVEMLSSGA